MVELSTGSAIVSLSGPGSALARISPFVVPDPGVPLTAYSATLGAQSPGAVWKSQPSVRKVVSFIARNAAVVSWKAYRRNADDDRQRISDSPIERALRRPRRFTSTVDFFERLYVDRCLYDRFGVVLMGGQLQRIPPRLLVLEADAFDNLARVGIAHPTGGDTFWLDDLPVAVSAGWSEWGAAGVSPLTTLAAILREQSHAVDWRDRQWAEAPKMSGVLKRPATARWSPEARDKFLDSWRTFRDSNAGGTPILEDGMEYEDLRSNLTPNDAKDIEGRQLTDAEVASAFHIPPELVGARQGTFSNITAFRQMLYGPALGPHLTAMQQAFALEIVPALAEDSRDYAELDRRSALKGDLIEQASVLSKLTGGPVMTRNEGRAELGLSRTEGGDELVLPMNVTAGGQSSPEDGGDGRPPGAEEES
ncbi:phage portal protein [Rathayibacter sp. VKM Ac-2630]|uniref:phage portal protein n=1 Tax=Rathayibacter sp. VKM Ac-2630 TaxID=1938617 RepID=UPI0009823D8B|nr:phage portal protein [Rathayibacter sp. VKM Ac-2630]OOB90739.1 hypothetical protein B0T42_10045 [Rathayibacter sp. VKM Ac-2630]